MGCSGRRNGNLQNPCAGVAGQFTRANAICGKKKPTLIGGRAYLPNGSDTAKPDQLSLSAIDYPPIH
jgi:hypothetical protein